EIGVAVPQVQRINGGINEAGCRNAVGSRLLIGQSQIAGPHGRGKTGSAVFVLSATALVGTDVKAKIRVGRDVWDIAIGLGTASAFGDRGHLPGGNINVGPRAAATVGPSGFRSPGAA